MTHSIIRTRPKPTCLLCGSTGDILYRDLTDRLFAAPGVWQLKQCSQPDCGLAWLDPAPVEEDLGLAYQSYYTHPEPTGMVAKLKYLLMSRGYRMAIAVPAILMGAYKERNLFMRMFLDELPPGRVLDVGCGDGRFLAEMVRRGWQGTGIDFDPAAVEAGRKKYNLNLRAGDIQSAQFEESNFDAITMSHLIEHLPDPVACLARCRELLRPGGRLVVTTPNFRSLGRRHFQHNWRCVEPPRHLQLFAPHLLAECAKRAGFVGVRVGSTAVNADYLANASFALLHAPAEANHIGGAWVVKYALPGILFQLREYLARRRDSDAGDEAFLICERGRFQAQQGAAEGTYALT